MFLNASGISQLNIESHENEYLMVFLMKFSRTISHVSSVKMDDFSGTIALRDRVTLLTARETVEA
jgi:hypothetical protein